MFYPAETGGVRTYLSAKSHWLAGRCRIAHTVIAPADGTACAGAEADRPSLLTVPAVRLPGGRGVRLPLPSGGAEALLRRLRPDLVEVGDPYQLAWSALRVKRAMNVPVVAFYHSDLPLVMQRRFGNLASSAASAYLRRLYGKFDLVLAPSRCAVRRLESLGIGPVRHQPLGVDTDFFDPSRRDPGLRQQLGLPEQTRLLIYAGRFSQAKNLPLLMDAIGHLGQPYHLLMVGGTLKGRTPAGVSCLPFQGRRELARLLASCDVLVHPGDGETFGLIVLEAMASGIPVVGVNAGGVAELIDERCGLLVDPHRSDTLVAGLRKLYRMDREAMGRAARRKVERMYDWRMIMPQLMHQYAGLLCASDRALMEAEASDDWI